MRVQVKYVIGKSTDIKIIDVDVLSAKSAARVLKISPRQVISVVKN